MSTQIKYGDLVLSLTDEPRVHVGTQWVLHMYERLASQEQYNDVHRSWLNKY